MLHKNQASEQNVYFVETLFCAWNKQNKKRTNLLLNFKYELWGWYFQRRFKGKFVFLYVETVKWMEQLKIMDYTVCNKM